MLFDTALISIFIPAWLVVLTCFLFSLAITLYGIPSVVRIAQKRNLYDLPGERTSHIQPIPRLGGTMIFAGIILPSILFSGLSVPNELKYIIAGMVILFFIGIKDDVVSLVPVKKAAGQLFAAAILVLPGDILLDYINFGPGYEIHESVANVLLTIFLVMTLINSINFIDGIDGLASGVGILVSLLLGIWYYLNNQLSYSILCFAQVGALSAFFYYNVFSRKNKIFLGDTGSMLIGFMLAVIVIHYLDLNHNGMNLTGETNFSPAIALALLFVPIFDTIRILIIRLYNRRSIFKADSNHVHHRVLKLSVSHIKATLIILTVNLLVILFTYFFQGLGNITLILILVLFGTVFSLILGSEE